MRSSLVSYFSCLVVIGILDFCWLSFAVGRVYRPGIGHLMAEKPMVAAALAFYLLYPAGVTYLITLPAAGDAGDAAVRGAVLGLMAYGTYDLTSLAILRGWPVSVTVIDMIWGAVITAVAAAVATLVTARFG
jgi:uncharacterized membrane protein